MNERQRSRSLTFVEEFRRDGRAMVRLRCDCGKVIACQRDKWRHRPAQSCDSCAKVRRRNFGHWGRV